MAQPLTVWNDCQGWQETALGEGHLGGVDEVGRGALFGPVAAAAVVVTLDQLDRLITLGVRDSKTLSPKKRQQLADQIPPVVTAYHISFADVPTINARNIRQASLLAMGRSLRKLTPQPDLLLVDGRDTLPDFEGNQQAIIQGDRQSVVIGAASILAKVWRDRLIERLAQRFPGYDLEHNKGYGTLKHRQGLEKLGKTPLHREKFCRAYR